jgi:hypothetical protein
VKSGPVKVFESISSSVSPIKGLTKIKASQKKTIIIKSRMTTIKAASSLVINHSSLPKNFILFASQEAIATY